MTQGLINERKAWDVKRGKQRLNIIDRPVSLFDSVAVEITTVLSTAATKINTPENGSNFSIIHKSIGKIIYIGTSEVTGSTNGYPLEAYEVLELKNAQFNNENKIYGIASSGSINITVLAEVME